MAFSQSNLSWSRQVKSDLAKEFRIVTFDLRGHGNSDKPLVPEAYRESRRWADDIDAIIKQTKGCLAYRRVGRAAERHRGRWGRCALPCGHFRAS
jgi:pimeloyl-ACP methyl ester carboxylesterase